MCFKTLVSILKTLSNSAMNSGFALNVYKKYTPSVSCLISYANFLVFQSSYWTDEETSAIILLELAVCKLNNIKVHKGPQIYYKQACDNFIAKFGLENCYVLDDFLVLNVEREFTTPEDFINHLFTKDHISLIKVGKNLINPILNSYKICDLNDLADNEEFLVFLDDFLNPNQHIKR